MAEMTESPRPRRRRRRPAVSCTLCRKRKIKCNRELPCNHCVHSRNNEACVYETNVPHADSSRESLDVDTAAQSHDSVPKTSPWTHSTSETVLPARSSQAPSASPNDAGKDRGAQRVLDADARRPIIQPDTSDAPDPPGVYDSSLFGQHTVVPHSVIHKGRLYGQSHWLNSVIQARSIIEMLEPHVRDSSSKTMRGIQRCKLLGKAIKTHRKTINPTAPCASLPPKPLADELVECYMRSSESIYRVLHIPTFKAEYETFYASGAQEESVFLATLKLVLAIGATIYDTSFSLRTSAVQWVLETQYWLASHKVKIEPSMQSVQIEILLLFARECTKVRWSKIWVSAGSLYRMAIFQGLNRDPTRLPKKSLLETEMWRRLWNTIIEINLQTSIMAGGPPLMSLDDFNTEPPGNFDDDQLYTIDAVAKPDDEFTQSSAAIALRKTFPARLAITKFLNDLGSHGEYEETLRLDRDLKAAFKELRQPFASYLASPGPRPIQFQLDALDFIVYRYILGLHAPFVSSRDPRHAYSRTVAIEASLKIWGAAWPAGVDDISRLTLCGCGFYRVTAMLAGLLLLQELRASLQQESLGPAVLRADLVDAAAQCQTWVLQCIRAGETNCKSYLLIALANAEIDGLKRGLDRETLANRMLRTLEEGVEECLGILEGQAAQAELDEVMADNSSPDAGLWDWNFLLPETTFDLDNGAVMSWF